MSQHNWKTYNPSWLVELASSYGGEYPWLAAAFAQCERARDESDFYTHFVDPKGPDWTFEESLILHHPEHGEVVIDVLRGNRIGGVEFLSRLVRRSEV